MMYFVKWLGKLIRYKSIRVLKFLTMDVCWGFVATMSHVVILNMLLISKHFQSFFSSTTLYNLNN